MFKFVAVVVLLVFRALVVTDAVCCPDGRVRLFINGENLRGARQTRWDPMLRPTRAIDGRWTVDAWAPLEGGISMAGCE